MKTVYETSEVVNDTHRARTVDCLILHDGEYIKTRYLQITDRETEESRTYVNGFSCDAALFRGVWNCAKRGVNHD